MVGPVGIFAFGPPPVELIAPLRTRALLAEAALQQLDLVFFASADCDIESGLVEAARWTLSGWETERLPLPGLVVIINDPLRDRDRQMDRWLRARTKTLVGHGPDKVDLPLILAGTPLAPHLIRQRELSAGNITSELSEWLAAEGASIVKPADGMRGGGIQSIEQVGDRWRARYRAEVHDGTMDDIVDYVARSIGGRMRYRRYIVQRFVQSRIAAGRSASVRVDVHKRPGGGWVVVKHFARIGEAGHFITNQAQGGYLTETLGFLSRHYRRPAKEILAELSSVALATAEHIDRQPENSIFELGIDFLIDPDEKVWLVEANVRPESLIGNHERAIHFIAYLRSVVA